MSTTMPTSPHALTPAHAALDLIARVVAALELTPSVSVCSFDRNGIIQFCNQACADLLGITVESAVGQSVSGLCSRGERQAEHDAMVAEVWRNGQCPPSGDWQIKTKDGRELWLYSTCIPVWHEGELAQIFFMEVDITQRRKEFDALQAAGANFHHMFERSSDAIFLLRDGVVEEANPAAVCLFKCGGPGRLVGRSLHDFSPMTQPSGQLSAEAEARMAEEARQDGNARGEWHYVDCEGSLFWAEVLLTAISLDGSNLYYVVVRDISERKRAERTLYLAAQVFENSRDAIVLTDRGRRVIALNRAFTDITGRSACTARAYTRNRSTAKCGPRWRPPIIGKASPGAASGMARCFPAGPASVPSAIARGASATIWERSPISPSARSRKSIRATWPSMTS
jgi:PAS domain S-box-containing protein